MIMPLPIASLGISVVLIVFGLRRLSKPKVSATLDPSEEDDLFI